MAREYSSSGWRQASLVDWLDSVDYAVRLIGVDHVGLGSDFNHGGGVTGYAHVGEAQNVTHELLKRGYSEEEIAVTAASVRVVVASRAQPEAGGPDSTP